ncbi:MAG TPA: hypothetical protein VK399_17780 [Longimicrobiaceae bacterium]|nr:hypothetical protein [Longimicrobiaceae bacterium]
MTWRRPAAPAGPQLVRDEPEASGDSLGRVAVWVGGCALVLGVLLLAAVLGKLRWIGC